jgi:TPR repeat protein
LIGDPNRPVVIIGTIWPEYYDRLREHGAPDDARTHLHRDAREVLRSAHRFELASEFSQAERVRAHEIAHVDPRVYEAAAHADIGSPTAVLACAPELTYRWKHASDSAGAAVLNAAVDIRVCGHVRVIPAPLLEQIAGAYLPAVERATATAQWFTSAARWATTPVRGAISALIPHATTIGRIDGYELSDILLADAIRNPDFSPHAVPVATWDHLAREADLVSCESIGFNAVTIRRLDAGRHALRRAADAGSVIAPAVLGFSYFDEGNLAEAMRWFQQANDLGLPDFAGMIAVIYRELGDSAQERLWLERAANVGNLGAILGYGSILEGDGDLDAAGTWYQQG